MSEVQIYVGNLGAGGASGANTFVLNRVDGAGNIVETLATFTPAYNVKSQIINLQDALGNGKTLLPTDYLRLDTGTLAGSLSTNPSDIKVTLIGKAYSIQA